METILLLVDHKGNRELLIEWLKSHFHIIEGEPLQLSKQPIDLCIIDGVALSHSEEQLRQLRKLSEPVFLPVLFITRRQDIGLATKALWKTVDELIVTPIEKIELEARVRTLLNARRLSFELKKRDKALLQKTEERFSKAFHTSPAGLTITRIADGKFVDANKSFCSMFEFSREEVIGHTSIELKMWTPDERKKLIDEQNKSGGLQNYELQARAKSGRIVHISFSSKPMELRGEPHLITTMIDITERKRSVEALRMREKQLSLIYNTVGDVIFQLSVEGEERYRFVSVNAAFCKVTGLPETAVVGKYVDEVIPEPSLSLVKEKYIQAIRSKAVVRWEETSRYPTGVLTGIVSIAPAFDEEGRCIYLVGSVHDITERKRVEEALRESEDKFKHVFESANVGKSITLPTGEIFINRAFADMLGYSPEELTNKTWQELTPPDEIESIQAILNSLLGGEKNSARFAKRYIHKNGSFIWADVNVVIRRDANGKPLHFITTIVDITERKRAEEELRHSKEQLRALAQHLQTAIEEERARIAREIHDDIGQIFTAIKMDLSLLLRTLEKVKEKKVKSEVAEEIHALIGLLDHGVQSIRKIVRDLRPEALETMGLLAGIEWQAKEFKKRTKISVSLSLPKDEPKLEKHQTAALFRIVQEALTNVARHAQATNVKILMATEQTALRLEIEDNGRGISENDFHRPGSFGLIAMQERIYSLGGEITISGRPGKGTKVEVRLEYVGSRT